MDNETKVRTVGVIAGLFAELDRLRILLIGVPMLLPFGTTGVTYSGLLRGATWLKEALQSLDDRINAPGPTMVSVADLPADVRIKEVEMSIKERILPQLRELMAGKSNNRFYSLAITQAYVCFTETCAFLLEEAKKNDAARERFGKPAYMKDRDAIALNNLIPTGNGALDVSQGVISEETLLEFAKEKLMLPADFIYEQCEELSFAQFFDATVLPLRKNNFDTYSDFLDDVKIEYLKSKNTIIEMMPGHTVK